MLLLSKVLYTFSSNPIVKFILRSAIFIFFGIILGECTVRYFKLVIDVPQREIDDEGVQKYKIRQSGYWRDKNLRWEVNKYGYVGCSDRDTCKETITIIGDSYIENFMNNDSCRQCRILKKINPNYNFIEGGRAGVSFIETFLIAKQFENLFKVKDHLVYISSHDIVESIAEINRYEDRAQFSVGQQVLLKAKLKSPGLKKVLYNFKFLYYLYIRFPLFVAEQNKGVNTDTELKLTEQDLTYIDELFKFSSEHLMKQNVYIVFHPEIDSNIVNIAKKYNYTILEIKQGSEKYSFENDVHWTCYGHQEVAKQVNTIFN